MKKQVFRIAVVFYLLCLSTSLKAQRTDAKDQGLKGPVTSVMTKDYGFTTSFGEKKQGELKEVSIYIFDSKGNITKESTKDGAFIYKNNYDKGKLISQDLLNGDGSLHQKIKYAYTGSGYVKTTYYGDGSVKSKIIKNGNILTKEEGPGVTKSYLNARGKEFKTNASLMGLDYSSSTTYNANGDPVIEKMQASFGYSEKQVVTYKAYRYDKYKNWIYREKYKDGKPDVIELRTMTY